MKMDIDTIKLEYDRGASVPQIAKKLGISQWSIYKAMKREGLNRRSAFSSNKLRFLASPQTFSKKADLSSEERELFVAGLMIYWAEGSKRGINTIDLANSDSLMVQIFLRFLREIYLIREEKLRVLLYCYSNQNVAALIKYWSRLTSIPRKQFSKPYVRTDWQLAKIGRMPHGMVHIRYSDQRLMKQLKFDIEDFTKTFL